MRDNLRARSKQENTSSWKVSKRLYNPLSSRRLIKSKEIPRTLKDYYMKGGTKYDFFGKLTCLDHHLRHIQAAQLENPSSIFLHHLDDCTTM